MNITVGHLGVREMDSWDGQLGTAGDGQLGMMKERTLVNRECCLHPPPSPPLEGKKAALAAKKGGKGIPAAAVEAIKARAAQSRAIAKDVDREFKEADAGPDARLQAQRQSKMLEALFEIYFR